MAYNEFDTSDTSLLLGAVNTLLQVINEAPLDSEAEFEDVEEAKWALAVIKEKKEAVLSEGWDINIDIGYVFPLDTNGEIPVPYNVLSLYSSDGDLIIRDGFIYSKSAQSRVFEDAQTVNVKWNMAFDVLPSPLRNLVTMVSAKTFQDRQIGDKTATVYTTNDVQDARAIASASEVSTSGKTMLTNMLSTGLRV